jgi:hypothetical protein
MLAGCSSDSAILGINDEDGDDILEEDPADPYEGAVLEILSPKANSFVPYGENTDFEAVLWSRDGEPLVFDDITWNSSLDPAWVASGSAFENDRLDVGVHTLRVNAELPNGATLFDAVGGVWVQSEMAGTYAGSVIVDADTGDFQVGCAGGAIVVVDAYGEAAEGEAECILSFQGESLELVYVFDLDQKNEELTGEAALDIFGFQIPTEFEGTVNQDGELGGFWEQNTPFGLDLAGELRVNRVTRDTSYFD